MIRGKSILASEITRVKFIPTTITWQFTARYFLQWAAGMTRNKELDVCFYFVWNIRPLRVFFFTCSHTHTH